MLELIVVETLIGLFLFMHIIRPYIKAFWRTRGFVFFPPLALLCCAAMIPAYGVRPECFPLYAGTLIYTIVHFPPVVSALLGLKSYEMRAGSILTSFLSAAFLAFSLAAAFRFLPEERYEDMPDGAAAAGGVRPAQEFTLHDPARDVDLFLFYYEGGEKGLVLLIPPLSFPVADEMRTAIGGRGYKTLTFTRPGFDREARDDAGVLHTVSFAKKVQYFALLLSGIKNEKQDAAQRLLAKERAADIRFILAELQKNGPLKTAVGIYDDLFLLGYGAGGAAAVELAGDRLALDAYPDFCAAAAVESIFLCDL